MSNLQFSHRVRFLPWVGTQYQKGLGGAKTLILGESHYRKDGKRFSRRLNIALIAGQADDVGPYTDPYHYWTKIVRLLSPKDPDPHRFWHSVGYYNYVQQFTGLVARDRPTQQMWRDAVRPFREVLAKLRPDLVLVLGRELWTNLPPARSLPGEDSEHFKEYPIGQSHAAVAAMINHPSSFGFAYADWRPAVRWALKLAARRAELSRCTRPRDGTLLAH